MEKYLFKCGALAMVCAAASLAEDAYTVGASYSDGEVTLTVPEEYSNIVGSGDLTLLILTEDGNKAESITNSNADEVVQIDQATSFSTVKVGNLTDGTYYVRIGGANANSDQGIPNGFIAGEFTVGSTEPEYTLGDVNADGKIDASDALIVQRFEVGIISELTDVQKLAANVNKDSAIDASDALAIKRFEVGIITSFN